MKNRLIDLFSGAATLFVRDPDIRHAVRDELSDILKNVSHSKKDVPLATGNNVGNRFISYSYPRPWKKNKNLGDRVQTIAVERALRQIFGDSLEFENCRRDALAFYEGTPAVCVMQGWYEHHTLGFLPGRNILPVWIGTHFEKRTRAHLKWLLRFRRFSLSNGELGARDFGTLRFCLENGIPAYFSRCLTLTLPRRSRSPEREKIFCVDVPADLACLLPENIRRSAEFFSQTEAALDSRSENDARDAAEKVLQRYRDEATLVVTTALHVSLPCVAMGVPVVLIDPGLKSAERFSAAAGIIPVWTKEDLKNGKINFSPVSPDIESLKQDLLENLKLSVFLAKGISVDAAKLAAIRNGIEHFSVV